MRPRTRAPRRGVRRGSGARLPRLARSASRSTHPLEIPLLRRDGGRRSYRTGPGFRRSGYPLRSACQQVVRCDLDCLSGGMDSQRPTPDLLVVVRRQWLLIALAVLVAAAVAFAVSRAQDKRYTASASLGFDVSTPLSNLLGQGSAPSADVQEREAATIADLVAARSVANRTARVVHRSPQAVADAIDVQAKGVSNIITVSATDRSPRFAARLANAYAATYVHTRRQDDSRSDQRALAAVHAQLARLTPRERQSSAGRLLQERADQLAAVAPLDQGSIALVSAAHVPSSPSSP